MSTGIEEEADRETGPYRTGLWARAWEWLATWLAVFPPHEILRDGLTRRLALRCCNWLWPLEATVRRLIIAAALAFDPAGLTPALDQASRKTANRKPASRAPSAAPKMPGFRVVSIRGWGAARTTQRVGAPCSITRHLPFPADDLLRLGSPHRRRNVKPALHRPNPLHRQDRILSSDPDYIPDSETDYANSSELLFGSRKDREPRSEQASDPFRHFRYRVPIESEDSEWRRIEKEWERVLPAPGIAARIVALNNVLHSPEKQIHRLARRLNANPDFPSLLLGAPPPVLRKPKHDHFGPQVDEDLPVLAWLATQPPDTS
jgi:hypothetical protein